MKVAIFSRLSKRFLKSKIYLEMAEINSDTEEFQNKENDPPAAQHKRLDGPNRYVREPWWCEEAAQLYNAIKQAKLIYRNTLKTEDFQEVTQAEKAFKLCINDLKFEWAEKKRNRKKNEEAKIIPDSRYVSLPWWCEEAAQLFKFKEEAKRKHFKSSTKEDLKAYKEVGDAFHTRLKELKWEWKQKNPLSQHPLQNIDANELENLNKNNGKDTHQNRYVPKPWWCEEASRLFDLRNKARQQYNITKKFVDALAYGDADRTFKRYMERKKRDWERMEKCTNNTKTKLECRNSNRGSSESNEEEEEKGKVAGQFRKDQRSNSSNKELGELTKLESNNNNEELKNNEEEDAFDKIAGQLEMCKIQSNINNDLEDNKQQSLKENIFDGDTSQNRFIPKPWWTELATHLVNERNQARTKYYKTNTAEDLQAYRKAENTFKMYIYDLKWQWKQKQKNGNQ
ncbi:uncharacterized protein [Musca autumnalis]|uniref:uncharacterized protein n=1 Tax=Musca autumnalis TaxID=221902 RepID=UPI003CEA2276